MAAASALTPQQAWGVVAAIIANCWVSNAFGEAPIFDAHLHYDAEHVSTLAPDKVIATFERLGIERAVVTSIPPEQVQSLYRLAPERIVPMLGVYRSPADKTRWTGDARLPLRIEQQLNTGRWCAIGELHLFGPQRHSPVFRQIVGIAQRHQLPVLLHTDPVVIDATFEQAPEATVVWAHAGAYPYPPLLRDYLERYPNLFVDLSVRDGRIAPAGELADDWEWLLLEYPDRFLAGADTYRPERWNHLNSVWNTTRNWLNQLPEEVASRIRFSNAARVYRCPAPE